MGSHSVPRNMNKVQRLWKGHTDKYILVAVAFAILMGASVNFFAEAESIIGKVIGISGFFGAFILWFVLARDQRTLDRTGLFIVFYIFFLIGKNKIYKYSSSDITISTITKPQHILKKGTIKFTNGYGWIYAFDCDSVNLDDMKAFSEKAQSFLDSLSEDIIFKIEVRLEPRQISQVFTDNINNLINIESDSSHLNHLHSIYNYSKEKETHDYEKRYSFFIGLISKNDLSDALNTKEKLERGLQDKINNLNIIFSQIKDNYLIYEFYAGEFT
jgi:hypothetical protein